MASALRVLILMVLVVAVLHIAEPVLMPLAVAGVFAMFYLPISRWMERRGVHRLAAAVMCVLSFVLLLAVIGTLLSWQISNITNDFDYLKDVISMRIERMQDFMVTHLGFARSQKDKLLSPQKTSPDEINKTIVVAASTIISVIGYLVLIVVYMTMLIFFRTHFKNFILKLVPAAEQEKANTIITQCSSVVQHYLSGLAIVIGFLWVAYSIGFSLVGIRTPVFFAILCGLLEVVPFVGNIVGSSITAIWALSQGGGVNMVIGVWAAYAIIQFTQFNIIAPLVMAEEVSINPVFTIAVIIAGEMVWGIPGMILAIPGLGIIKIICDNVEPLRPYGYLIGRVKMGKRKSLFGRMKAYLERKGESVEGEKLKVKSEKKPTTL